jgi:hypothetical protein
LTTRPFGAHGQDAGTKAHSSSLDSVDLTLHRSGA